MMIPDCSSFLLSDFLSSFSIVFFFLFSFLPSFRMSADVSTSFFVWWGPNKSKNCVTVLDNLQGVFYMSDVYFTHPCAHACAHVCTHTLHFLDPILLPTGSLSALSAFELEQWLSC